MTFDTVLHRSQHRGRLVRVGAGRQVDAQQGVAVDRVAADGVTASRGDVNAVGAVEGDDVAQAAANAAADEDRRLTPPPASPMVLFELPVMWMPLPLLPKATWPVTSVPMSVPITVLPWVPFISMPSPTLPLMTVSSVGSVEPMVFADVPGPR